MRTPKNEPGEIDPQRRHVYHGLAVARSSPADPLPCFGAMQ